MRFRLYHLLLLSTAVCAYAALAIRLPALLSVIGYMVFLIALVLAGLVALALAACLALDFLARAAKDPADRMDELESQLDREAKARRRHAREAAEEP